MPFHQFGIMDSVDKKKSYIDFCPEKYNCVAVDDDVMDILASKLQVMPTYFFSLDKKEYGLNYYGITLIPPGSCWYLQEILSSNIKQDDDIYIQLLELVEKAKLEEKFIIHFGI